MFQVWMKGLHCLCPGKESHLSEAETRKHVSGASPLCTAYLSFIFHNRNKFLSFELCILFRISFLMHYLSMLLSWHIRVNQWIDSVPQSYIRQILIFTKHILGGIGNLRLRFHINGFSIKFSCLPAVVFKVYILQILCFCLWLLFLVFYSILTKSV